jgi:predicted dinucleotide-binding enzyme
MKIAVLGSGKIGGTLARKWGAAGHEVVFGVRNPAKPEVQALLREIGPNTHATSLEEAVTQAEVVLFAIPGIAMRDAVQSLGAALDGKLVIDATNIFGDGEMKNSVAAIQQAAPHAQVIRAFNCLAWENFSQPTFHGVQADLLYASPEGEPQTTAERLIADIGLRPIRLGGIDKAPVVDGITLAWWALAFEQQRGRHLAFKVLTD